MKKKKKQVQICISDVSGLLQIDIDKCAVGIREKKPDFITPTEFHESQLKQNRSSIVRMAMRLLVEKVESC